MRRCVTNELDGREAGSDFGATDTRRGARTDGTYGTHRT
jgi:hypothetical protein